MLEGVADLSLDQLNEATLAWIEVEYNRKVHSEIGQTPLQRYLNDKDVGRPCPDTAHLRLAFTTEVTRTQRRSDGSFSLEGIRFEVPSRYAHFHKLWLYRNGIQVASVAYDGTLQEAPAMNCLGIGVKPNNDCSGAAAAPGFWQGKMDDMGLWTRDLSAGEIQALYTSGLDGRNTGNASLSPPLEIALEGADLVFSWPEAPLGRGFALASTLSLPADSWTPVAAALTVADGRCSVRVPADSAAMSYFRLQR